MRWRESTVLLICTGVALGCSGGEPPGPEPVVGKATSPLGSGPFCDERPGPLPIRLEWVGIGDSNVFETAVLQLRILNESGSPVSVRPMVLLHAAGAKQATIAMSDRRLDSGATSDAFFTPGTVPLLDTKSSVQATVQLDVLRADGTIVTQTSDPIFLHLSPTCDKLLAYRFEPLVSSFGGGALAVPDGPTQTCADLGEGPIEAPVLGASPGPGFGPEVASVDVLRNLTESAPRAPLLGVRQFTLCTSWKAAFVDGGYGEDLLATSTLLDGPAKYAEARITAASDAHQIYWSGFLGANSCTPPVALPPGSYVLSQTTHLKRVSVYYEIYGDPSNNAMLTISSQFTLQKGTPYEQYPALFQFHPMLHNSYTRVAAAIPYAMEAPDNGIAAGIYKVYANSSGGGYNPYNDSVVLTSTDTSWKNVITHELGHQVQARRLSVLTWDYEYYCNNFAYCSCSGFTPTTNHCLQSREYVTAAEMEGFAHFFAAKVWNRPFSSDCGWGYYKSFWLPPNQQFLSPPVARTCQTAQRWLLSYCPISPGSDVPGSLGVEWDWQLFFWNANSQSADHSTMDDIFGIYLRACLPAQNCALQDIRWAQLHQAAYQYYGSNPDDEQFVYFAGTGNYAGVVY